MADFRTLDDLDVDLDVAGRRVILRADLNVPVVDGQITDDSRIRAIVPSLRALTGAGASVVVLSHFGRPRGRIDLALSLRRVAEPLARASGLAVTFAEDCIGPRARQIARGLAPGAVALMENLRFHPGEQANDPAFAAELARLGEIYVNDAFSTAHRAHASTEALAHLLPAAAGRAMAGELAALAAALGTPEHPVAAVVGGAKISTKLAVLGNLIARMDVLVIGGGMANTFLNARGVAVGKSLCEHDLAAQARAILATAKAAGCTVILPLDAVVASEFKAGAAWRTVDIAAVDGNDMILDIGPRSVAHIIACLEASRTVLWNGPLGAFEIPPFDGATVAVARATARLSRAGRLKSVAGGGDTLSALGHAGVIDDFSHVSTAGGAFLEWLEGKQLPGVKALEMG